MDSIRQFTTCVVIFSILFYFPGAAFAEPDAKRFSHATPGEATGLGQFVHGAKPGVLLIRVHLMGSVTNQGIHFFPEGTNLLDALLYAGGMDVTTKLSGIAIRRKGIEDAIEYDLEEILEDGEAIPSLKDGDIVRIPWNWRRDIATISLITGFMVSVTGFTLAVISLAKD